MTALEIPSQRERENGKDAEMGNKDCFLFYLFNEGNHDHQVILHSGLNISDEELGLYSITLICLHENV